MNEDFYRVYGGDRREGAIVVSQLDEAVDYSPMLSGRVANLVPIDDIDQVTLAVNAYTQTIGIYPESLKHQLRDLLPLFGAQRLTSLGYACSVSIATPQDAIDRFAGCASGSSTRSATPTRSSPVATQPHHPRAMTGAGLAAKCTFTARCTPRHILARCEQDRPLQERDPRRILESAFELFLTPGCVGDHH